MRHASPVGCASPHSSTLGGSSESNALLPVGSEEGQPAQRPTLGEDVAEVGAFLVSHVENLLDGAQNGLAPVTALVAGDGASHFDTLREGSDDESLRAADSLTKALVTEMGRVNSKEGVLVCGVCCLPSTSMTTRWRSLKAGGSPSADEEAACRWTGSVGCAGRRCRRAGRPAG